MAALLAAPIGIGARAAPAAGPIGLSQTLPGTVQVSDGPAHPSTAIDTLKQLYPALAACWEVPAGLARFERTKITARFSLRRDGSVIGTPRVTFASHDPDSRARAMLTQATLEALRRCTPVKVTPALGGAIAGRPIALRFLYQGPTGQGI